jgi:hypothetical protein
VLSLSQMEKRRNETRKKISTTSGSKGIKNKDDRSDECAFELL